MESGWPKARATAAQRIAIIDALASALDEKTFVEKLVLGGDEIEITLVSPSAADVLKAVSAIPDLSDASLKSGVSRDADSFERFTISAKIPALPNAGDAS